MAATAAPVMMGWLMMLSPNSGDEVDDAKAKKDHYAKRFDLSGQLLFAIPTYQVEECVGSNVDKPWGVKPAKKLLQWLLR